MGDESGDDPNHMQLIQEKAQNDPMTSQQFGQYQLQQNPYQIQSSDFQAMPQAAVSRGTWTQQEDEQLIMAVNKLAPKKWLNICKFVPTRTSKQCRERWYNCLSPTIKHGAFEAWEDQIIIEKQKEIGNKWASIARYLPGRSPGAIKNRWYSGLKVYHPSAAVITEASLKQDPLEIDAQRSSVHYA